MINDTGSSEGEEKPQRNLKGFFKKYRKAIIFFALLLVSILFIINFIWYFGADVSDFFKYSFEGSSKEGEFYVEEASVLDLKNSPSKYYDKQVRVSGELEECTYFLTEAANSTLNESEEVWDKEDLVEKESEVEALCFKVEKEYGRVLVSTNLLDIESKRDNLTAIGYLRKASRLSDLFEIEQILNSEYLGLIENQEEILHEEINIFEVEEKIHEKINELRVRENLSKLDYANNLANIARAHSMDMAENDFLDNKNLEGDYAGNRVRDAGFYCLRDNSYSQHIGENIYQNWVYSSIEYSMGVPKYNWISEEEIAESTISGWMNNSESRDSLLSSDYSKEGIGIAIADEKVYITQNLC